MSMLLERRKFLIGLVAAPFVVRSGILMPVRQLIKPEPIVLSKPGVAVLEYSNDGVNWIAGPIIDMAMPVRKGEAAPARYWRAKMLADMSQTIEIQVKPLWNEVAA